MKLYLAAAYDRRTEIAEYAHRLRGIGVPVVSRWVFAEAECEDDAFERADTTTKIATGFGYAMKDLADIDACTHFVLFADGRDGEPSHVKARGGRHFETGYAFATDKYIIIVGGIENVFHCLPGIVRLPTFDALLAYAKQSLGRCPDVVQPARFAVPELQTPKGQ